MSPLTTAAPMSNISQEALAPYVTEVEDALQSALAEFGEPGCLYDPVHYLFEGGGKRIRPGLTLLACECVGGDRAVALPAALAVGRVPHFTLVHDDIRVRSARRRVRDKVDVKCVATK